MQMRKTLTSLALIAAALIGGMAYAADSTSDAPTASAPAGSGS